MDSPDIAYRRAHMNDIDKIDRLIGETIAQVGDALHFTTRFGDTTPKFLM